MVSQRRRRELKIRLWFVLFVACVVLALLPVQSGVLRRMLVGGIFLTWASGLFLFWRSIVARVLFLLPLVAAIGLALIPYRLSNGAQMRAAYTKALRSYEGVKFLSGGESRWGMDSSGLIRAAMMNACFAEGWQTKDLGLLRAAAALWWYDASIEEIGKGYNGRARVLISNTVLNTADYAKLQPGDLAVTTDNQQVLAYLGEKTWISTDLKTKQSVVTEKAPSGETTFSATVNVLRWYRLQ